MGTRSLTFVYDRGEKLLCMYRQFDGYPSGHGMELSDFLNSKTLVNGLGGKTTNVANGMGCLAAQMIAQFKSGPGGIYIYPINSDETDVGQEFEYHVTQNEVKVLDYDKNVWFQGSYENFRIFCQEDDQ